MLDRKNKEILELLSEEQYITAQEIGKRLAVSEKTVRTRLHEAMDAVAEYGAQILSKPRYGYCLRVVDAERWNRFRSGEAAPQPGIPASSGERVEYILAELLRKKPERFIKMEPLSERLYVSSKTLTGELRQVRYILQQFSLSLDSRPHYGVRAVGSEFNKRCCILQNFFLTQSPFWNTTDAPLPAQKIADVFLRLIRQNHIRFTEVSFQKTVCYLQLSLLRMRQGFRMDPVPAEELEDIRLECEVSRALYRELLCPEETVPEEEIFYTGIYIAGKRIMGVGREIGDELVASPRLEDRVTQIFEALYQTYGVDFRKDLNLRVLLLQHLRPMEIRLRYDIPVEMCAEDIKEKYFFCYTMAQLAATILEQEFGKPLPEEELLCLSIYFALAMDERSTPHKKKNNILLICVSGKASAQLLVHRFKKEFSAAIQSLTVCSLYDFEHIDLSRIDMIFSTVLLYKPVPVPVMQVRNFFDGQELLCARQFLESGTPQVIDRYFCEELFFPDLSGSTKEEVLHALCCRIAAQRDLPEGFEQAVLQRETMASTDFGNLCAIPHPCRMMTPDSFAAAGILPQPIHWQRNPVQVVILVSLKSDSGEENQEFYSITAEFLSNEDAVRQLLAEPTFRNFRKILTGLKR